MTVNDIYLSFGEALHESTVDEDWKSAHLFILCLEGTARFNAHYLNIKDEKTSIKARNFSKLYESVHELHAITTEGGHNRWNRLEFTLFPDFKFDMKFIWDQELQDEVDGYNRQM